MKHTPSHLPVDARTAVCDSLRSVLADGIDLHTQLKVAHWNIKGMHFAALHPLFETFATDIAAQNDAVAERVLTLGGLAVGTARHVARHSRLADYPQDVTRDSEHVKLLAGRMAGYLAGVRESRKIAQDRSDDDTVDLLTGIASMFEKHAWFLHATMES